MRLQEKGEKIAVSTADIHENARRRKIVSIQHSSLHARSYTPKSFVHRRRFLRKAKTLLLSVKGNCGLSRRSACTQVPHHIAPRVVLSFSKVSQDKGT